MSLHQFDRLLKEKIGLDAASIGDAAVERAVNERKRACAFKSDDEYWERLQRSNDELQQLIEAVVVPETWFFRDPEAFAALSRLVLEPALSPDQGSVLRLLSIPCSTGEEPYSIAMALLDAGLAPERFRVDAVDISERAVNHAKRGMYGKSSFRGSDISFRDRYFKAAGNEHSIVPRVRGQVNFQSGNMFDPGFLPGADLYDVIFCRNVLIYFDADTQARSIAVLSRLLRAGGVLFVGSSEAGAYINSGFASARIPMAFAFLKGARPALATAVAPPTRKPTPTPTSPRPTPRAIPPRVVAPAKVAVPTRTASPSTPLSIVPADSVNLDDARRLADQGGFAEAARVCEDYLRRHGPAADAYYLLGLVRDASGNLADARIFYKKALYLEPNHADALMHLALLLEQKGDGTEARLLRNRVKRLEQGSRA